MKWHHLLIGLAVALSAACSSQQPAPPPVLATSINTAVVSPVAASATSYPVTGAPQMRPVFLENEPCPAPTRVAPDGVLEINEAFIRLIGQPAYVAGDRNGWIYKYTQKGAPGSSKYEVKPGSAAGWYRLPDGWHSGDQFNLVQRDDSSGHPGEVYWMQIQCAYRKGGDPHITLRPDNSGDMAIEIP